MELQKAMKKKDRVDKEEREMYRRMVSNPPKSAPATESTRHSLWKRLVCVLVTVLIGHFGKVEWADKRIET